MPDQEREIPADILKESRALAAYARAMRDQAGVDMAIAAALAQERERAARITIEKGGEWLELAQAIAAAIRDHSGREK